MTTMPNPISCLAVSAVSLALAGCATVSTESQVREGLIDAGLSPRISVCMAKRMVDRLSLSQLRQLKSVASLRTADMGAMSMDRFLYKVRGLEDPEIIAVTSNAALRCAF